MVVNGKNYLLWGQFVKRQNEYIGGILEEISDGETARTKITGITLKENGPESAYFSVEGEDFGCGFDVQYGGIVGGDPGWVGFSGMYGLNFRIKSN